MAAELVRLVQAHDGFQIGGSGFADDEARRDHAAFDSFGSSVSGPA